MYKYRAEYMVWLICDYLSELLLELVLADIGTAGVHDVNDLHSHSAYIYKNSTHV